MTILLSKMIRKAVEDKDNPVAEEVAEEVFRGIPEAYYPQVIRTLLNRVVTTEIGNSRGVVLRRVRGTEPDDFTVRGGTATAPAKTFLGGDDDETPNLTLRDPKASMVIAAFLNQHVPVREGEIKRIRNLTAEDCRIVAEARFEQARANVRNGQGYLKCAETIEALGVDVLGDLDGREVHLALTA